MPTLQDKEDSLMKLNSKRIDFEYTPGEEIFTFPEDTGCLLYTSPSPRD